MEGTSKCETMGCPYTLFCSQLDPVGATVSFQLPHDSE